MRVPHKCLCASVSFFASLTSCCGSLCREGELLREGNSKVREESCLHCCRRRCGRGARLKKGKTSRNNRRHIKYTRRVSWREHFIINTQSLEKQLSVNLSLPTKRSAVHHQCLHSTIHTCHTIQKKAIGAPITKVSPCFRSFILLKRTGVQERKSVVCNQRSSCAISGLHSKGGERWHNYIALFCAPSSVNAVCVTLGKSCQPRFRAHVEQSVYKGGANRCCWYYNILATDKPVREVRIQKSRHHLLHSIGKHDSVLSHECDVALFMCDLARVPHFMCLEFLSARFGFNPTVAWKPNKANASINKLIRRPRTYFADSCGETHELGPH